MKLPALICLALTSFGANLAYPLNLSEAHVYAESLPKDAIYCGINEKSLIAAVESSLRYNRIAVVAPNYGVVNFYIHANVLRRNDGSCFGSSRIKVEYFDAVSPPFAPNKRVTASIELCTRGTIFVGPSSNFRNHITNELRNSADECISEISKK